MLYKITSYILVAVLFISCQKSLTYEDGGSTAPPDLSTKISSSVSGFVTDENDAAVIGATIQFGTTTITTDKYGYFEVKNAQVVKEAAVVTVTKPGYFKGIKTYIAKEGKAAFFRIKLVPKTTVGNINAASGGTVTLANGLSIKLPAGGIVNAATNTAYTGTVNVAAFWINPTAADLNKIMPGDLRGINSEGALKLLQTFGMAAVELTGSAGELLQIVNGQKATLTLPIPSSLSASAPASIPLWYFDEVKGLWKQEGSGTKTGNTYVGDVGHFSFWNYDIPGNYVQFDCTLKDATGNPIPFVPVRISVNDTGYNSRFGYTDASGYIGGLVPANAQLILEVFPTYYYCNTPVYTQIFTTSNANISLGDVVITTSFTATISGSVTNCNNNRVTNGSVIMFKNGLFVRYPLSNTGTFNFSTILCNNTAAVTLVAEDLTASQQSVPYISNLVVGSNVVGNLQACNNSTAEFIHYSINGVNYSLTAPVDSVNSFGNSSVIIYLYGSKVGGGDAVNISFGTTGIGVNSLQQLTNFTAAQLPFTAGPNPMSVHITEYGALGEFISGNFTGTLTDNQPPNTVYNLTCSFRVRRTF
jgi:hypothetical protein